ncbi:galactose mutarotase-like protein, partial [Serendipita vermifera]
GLAVNSIYLNAVGETHDIVQGPLDWTQHPTPPYKYMNTLVGRYANRIAVKEGGHHIEKNGYSGTVVPIKNEGEKVSLHGGPDTLDSLLFDQLKPEESTLFSPKELAALQTADFANAIFTATLGDGHNGFPGTLRVEVLFAVIDPPTGGEASAQKDYVELGSLLVVYRARLAEPGKVTPVNLTQHWGFNLEASLRPTPNLNIRDHFLTVQSPSRVAVDEILLPTGQLEDNRGTSHEHSSKRFRDNWPEKGYDHFYLFAKELYDKSIVSQPPRTAVSDFANQDLLTELLTPSKAVNPSVELWSEKSGYKVQFTSNQGGVQTYTANFQNGAGTRKKIHGGVQGGDGYPKEGAVYLEFHDPLSAFLHTHNGIDSLLTSDELYHNYVKLNLSYKVPSA